MTTKRASNPTKERGETLILCIALVVVFLAFLAVGFDLPRAIAAKTEQESALDLAREAEMAPAIGIVAKNSDDPGALIAAELVRSLRAGGYADRIEVWFTEVPASELPANRRVFGYQLILESDLDPVFAKVVGASNVHVASSLVSLSMPYAETSVWRPAAARTGVYTARADSASIAFASKSPNDLPSALRSELAQGTQTAN